MVFDILENSILLRVRLNPNSSALNIKGVFVDADEMEYLKIGVLSPPEKGRANQELMKFLSKQLGVAKSNIEIVSGELSHYKKVLLNGNKDNIVSQIELLLSEASG